jgi:GNAT superfamily N-acetyltransferase
MSALLRIGSCDGIKVWLNGEQVWSNNKNRKAKIDEDIVPVQLSAGRNELLLKMVNHEANDWGFYCRITDSNGKQIPDLVYISPETSHIHNQILSHEQLLHLANSENDRIRCFAVSELAVGGDKRGIETLAELLQSQDESSQAKAALTLTRLKDQRGIETLVELAPKQNYFFQLDASYALQGVGDARAEKFSLTNLKDENGNKVGELKIEDKEGEFIIEANLCGKEMGFISIGHSNRTLHFGNNIGAKYASIAGFGMYAPKYREKGIGEMLIKKASQMMEERGFSCSMVGTGTKLLAHRLYTRYGYVDAAFRADYIKNLESEADPHSRDGFAHIPRITDNSVTVRRYDKEDETEIKRLREDYCLNSIGPVSNTPRDRFGPWTMVMEREYKIIGYADAPYDLFDPIGRINIVHIDSKIPDSKEREKYTKIMLVEIYRYFLNEGKKQVIFHDPPSHIRRMLLQLGHHPDENSERHGWVGMFKIIDLTKLLNEISELLKLRLERSIYAGWRGEIGILSSRLRSTLKISEEVNAESEISQSADIVVETSDKLVTELMVGKTDIWGAYRQLTFSTKPAFNERIRGLLETLFPIMERRERGWW